MLIDVIGTYLVFHMANAPMVLWSVETGKMRQANDLCFFQEPGGEISYTDDLRTCYTTDDGWKVIAQCDVTSCQEM